MCSWSPLKVALPETSEGQESLVSGCSQGDGWLGVPESGVARAKMGEEIVYGSWCCAVRAAGTSCGRGGRVWAVAVLCSQGGRNGV